MGRRAEIVFRHRPLGKYVDSYMAETPKFKGFRLDAFLQIPLARETATRFALLPMLLRRGTRTYPTMRALSLKLEELYGAEASTSVFKLGELQFCSWSMRMTSPSLLPSKAAETFAEAVGVFLQMIFSPHVEGGAFKEAYVRQEKENLKKMMKALKDDKMAYAVIRLFEEMCPGEPFSVHEYGFLEDVDPIDPGALHSFYRWAVSQNPLKLFAVGDGPAEETAALLEDGLGRVRFQKPSEGPEGIEAGRRSGRGIDDGELKMVVEEQDISQSKLALGLRTPVTRADEGYPALLVCDAVLGGSPQSKLFLNVREKASLAYFAFSRVEATKGVMVVLSGIDPQNKDTAMRIIKDQIDALSAGDVSSIELDHAKKALMNKIRSRADSPGHAVMARLEGIINGRDESDEDLLSKIQDVTKDEVVAVARGLKLTTAYFLTRRSQGR